MYHWEDPTWERGESLLKASITGGSCQFSCDDLSVSPGVSKSKKGPPDPRFKRVVGSGLYDEIANEARKVSESLARAAAAAKDDERPSGSELIPVNKGSKIPTFLMKKNTSKPSETHTNDVPPAKTFRALAYDRFTPQETPAEPEKKAIGSGTKTKYVEHSPPKTDLSKKSFSDCTLQTKNTSDDQAEDIAQPVSYTSTTRLNKVNNWIQYFKPTPEKRRSVITVIGQTQGKSFSTVLNEINQRRKLAKELDRHALCETILQSSDTAADREPKNLIAKVDLFSPDGKVVYSARKTFGFRDSGCEGLKGERCQECPYSNGDLLRTGLLPFKLRDQIPERDLSMGLGRKRKLKRSSRKVDTAKFDFGRVVPLVSNFLQNQLAVAVTVLLCAAVFAAVVFTMKDKTILNYLHLRKPKTRTWYDQLFT